MKPIVSEGKFIEVPKTETYSKIDISGYAFDNNTMGVEGYSILYRTGEACEGLSYFPKTSKIVLNNRQHSLLMENFNVVIPKVAEDLQISKEVARDKYVDFFSNAEVVVQPIGVQGRVYQLVQSTQNWVPMAYTTEAVSVMKTAGITGLQVIVQAPLTFVGATYIGALFFGYCGGVAGNNPVGLILNSTSFVLSRPMRGVEIVLNGLILRPISNQIGLPIILNGTQQILKGKGLPLKDYTKIGIAFERISNSRVVHKAKQIYKIIRHKDK